MSIRTVYFVDCNGKGCRRPPLQFKAIDLTDAAVRALGWVQAREPGSGRVLHFCPDCKPASASAGASERALLPRTSPSGVAVAPAQARPERRNPLQKGERRTDYDARPGHETPGADSSLPLLEGAA